MTPEPQSNDAPGFSDEQKHDVILLRLAEAELDRLRAELEQAKQDLKTHWNHTCQTLESQIRELKEQLDATRVDNIDLKNIIEEGGKVHDARRAELEQAKQRHEKELSELAEILTQARTALADTTKQRDEASQRASDAQTSLAEALAKARNAEKARDRVVDRGVANLREVTDERDAAKRGLEIYVAKLDSTQQERDAALAQADALRKERDAAVLCQAAIQQAFDELSDALRQRVAELETVLDGCITGLERAQLWIDVESVTYGCTCGTSEHCPYCTKGTAASGAVARALAAATQQPAPAAQQAKHEAATTASREAYDRAYNAPDAPAQ